MQILRDIHDLRKVLSPIHREGKAIGMVPTMGAIHEGHLGLIRECRRDSDVVLVSIFVNPLQFPDPRDLRAYPRTASEDIRILEANGVNILFMPDLSQMYGPSPEISLNLGYGGSVMEGEHRKGHLEGVGIVVIKLLCLVRPVNAYFGIKDLQQLFIVRKLNEELSLGVRLFGVDTVREGNGLACSSRNRLLSENGKNAACQIYQGLQSTRQMILESRDVDSTVEKLIRYYDGVAGIRIEYVCAVNPWTMRPARIASEGYPLAFCVAADVEGVRLLDNIYYYCILNNSL